MPVAKSLDKRRQRRVWRVRNQIKRFATARFRLSIFRSNKHIYAQVIDDAAGVTVAFAGSDELEFRTQFPNGGNCDAATAIGKLVAQRCLATGASVVVFDRGAYKYHGRVAALAESARSSGLQF